MRKYICKDTGEMVYGYRNYLKTKHWQNVRSRMYDSKFEYKCYCCGAKSKLQLHHKSYKSVGNENLNHLIWLCANCHSEIHVYLDANKSNRTTLWNVARKVKKNHY